MRSFLTRIMICGLVLFPSAAAGTGQLPLDHQPPGKIVKTVTVYLAGEAMNSRYLTVASQTLITPAKGQIPARYQPYLTIYTQNGNNFQRMYQSPGPNDYLKLVPKITPVPNYPGAYAPSAVSIQLAGKGDFFGDAREELVVGVHTIGADCGGITVHVLTLTQRATRLFDLAQVENYCDLNAAIVKNTLVVNGPYYNSTAPLCCPTKNNVKATIRYNSHTRTWSESPRYFKLTQTNMPRKRQ